MPLIRQALDALALVVIAHVSREGYDGAGSIITDDGHHRLGIEWSIDHFDKTNCAHAAIIGALG